jgi:hypothetical protein
MNLSERKIKRPRNGEEKWYKTLEERGTELFHLNKPRSSGQNIVTSTGAKISPSKWVPRDLRSYRDEYCKVNVVTTSSIGKGTIWGSYSPEMQLPIIFLQFLLTSCQSIVSEDSTGAVPCLMTRESRTNFFVGEGTKTDRTTVFRGRIEIIEFS